MKLAPRSCMAALVLATCLAACVVDDDRPSSLYFAERVGGAYAPWQIMVLEADGAQARQLTSTDGADNDEPDVSPDGTLVAFASKRDFPPPTDGWVQNPTLRMIYLMNSDGTNQRRLTANSLSWCSEHTPRFSPDGKWIVFAMSCDDVAPSSISRLYRVRVDGSAQEALATSHPELAAGGNQVSPAFDETGANVLFIGELAQGSSIFELWSVSLADRTTRRLTRCADAGRSVIVRNRISVADGAAYFASDDGLGDDPAAFERVASDGSQPQERRFAIPLLTSPESLQGVPSHFERALSSTGGRIVAVKYDDLTVDPPTEALVSLEADGSQRVAMRSGGRYSGATWH
jgi:dipeptidyl aminopeptidase/acylaminoacyl peptidase